MKKSLINNAPMPAPNQLSYSWAEVARLLGIGRVSVWRLEKRGLLKPIPTLKGRYTGDSVRALCSGSVEATA